MCGIVAMYSARGPIPADALGRATLRYAERFRHANELVPPARIAKKAASPSKKPDGDPLTITHERVEAAAIFRGRQVAPGQQKTHSSWASAGDRPALRASPAPEQEGVLSR